ncbi:TMEM175 family protein [Latilactobacillus curvatus]|uniref:TMEM175 family protein n=1 Tax=Latilactobacillus curvatus TaxID=28038 RepID=UPI0024BA8C19|nr:TMEM175 family protein [Latilactobacillus curvatus]WHQ78322.1 TMEM175 family protein [Latilactobacillus curvatus]
MNKGRLEAFSDAVIAIIVTIMILEFKTSETPEIKALLENGPYFFAYIITYVFVGVAWYNHYYMFSLTKRGTKRIYWLNNIWLLSMSFLPVATAWTGRFINERGPEYFYYVVHLIWLLAYFFLSDALANANREVAPERYQKIKAMPIYSTITRPYFWVIQVILLVAIYFFPPIELIFVMVEIYMIGNRTDKESDQLFND